MFKIYYCQKSSEYGEVQSVIRSNMVSWNTAQADGRHLAQYQKG